MKKNKKNLQAKYNYVVKKAWLVNEGLVWDSKIDLRFNHSVHITSQGGDTFLINGAFIEREGEFYIIYCEHFHPFVFFKNDLEFAREYTNEIIGPIKSGKKEKP